MRDKKVDVIIPTYRPDDRFMELLIRLQRQSHQPEKLVVINTDKAGWEEFVRKHGGALSHLTLPMEVSHIEKSQFDHAATRNLAASKCEGDYLLMMTMDALPADRRLIASLVEAFSDKEVAVAYARQLPRKNAGLLERRTRAFNYPDTSCCKGIEDLPKLGIKTYFCSDVCAMYDRSLFMQAGGFEEPAIFNEDMVFAAGIMKQGYKVCYRAEACVYHSHNYGGLRQLSRNFDLGVSQVLHPEVFSGISSEKEGVRMILSQARQLAAGGHYLTVMKLFWISGCKWIGYFLGRHYRRLPRFLIYRITMNPEFWNRKHKKEEKMRVCAE